MTTLPKHIRQLVDKKNYVIAIKTHAQEQNISIDEAKHVIDAYEASQTAQWIKSDEASHEDMQKPTPNQGFANLQTGVDNHLQQQNIKLPLMPYWVKRVTIILLVLAIFGGLIYQQFRG
ncbi:hypothetical protein [Faucicola boevrei]|uniref:hypothetical protein n=1 Tax=Faucicola boevrei TaxID=346665 RepID=UPI00036F3481|nr:hypothetical protein [Moraxella boevrei]